MFGKITAIKVSSTLLCGHGVLISIASMNKCLLLILVKCFNIIDVYVRLAICCKHTRSHTGL